MAKLNFNAAEKEPMQEFSSKTIPEGKYLAQITKSEIKPTKKNDGKRLNLTFRIIGKSEHAGTHLFVGLNVENPSQQAVEISDRELKSICDAVGKGKENIQDSEELHGIPMEIEVDIEPPSGEYTENGETKFRYKAKNKITGYAKAEGSTVLGDSAAPTQASGSDLPWKDDD